MSWSTTLLFFLFSIFYQNGFAFNVDLSSVITHRGPAGSMFGFSIAQHRDSNISWILVGAPSAETNQPGVKKPGAVYRCSCETSNYCQVIPFDRQGNNQVDGKQIDEKSGQWFGASVRSSGEDGIILACAPRYTWFTANRKRKDPVGTCWVAKDSFTEYVEYSPCRTSKWGYHRQGSCQLGLGADVDSDGRRLFLGAVGSWYWQGQLFLVDSRRSSPENRVPYYQFIQPGQLYSQSVTTKPDIRWTREGPNYDDDSYLGYSVAHGKFSDGKDTDVAVGMPRGANLTGKVVIYSGDLTSLHNITGDQIGAYFGYSLCISDMDGDGLDDIVVGAPMYTDFGDTTMKIETGRVYIIYQTKRHKFRKWDALDGAVHRGRFGHSITTLGDLNRDGYHDIAVGAPYSGENGRGAVYIYYGSETGVRKEHSQVIYAESLSEPISTFGFSVSGGRDLDGNGYPDLLVGAYYSNYVAYFRSRPVVRVTCNLSFTSPSKQIDLESKTCRLRDNTPVSCMNLKLCMEYDGNGVDDAIDFNVQYLLDSLKPRDPRMFFMNYEGRSIINQTVQLYKKKKACQEHQVYLKPQIMDKLTSLDAEFKYSMIEHESQRRRRQLLPIIDTTTANTHTDSVSIKKNCGHDNICVPDLRIQVEKSDQNFLLGSTEKIWLDVEIRNNQEESYESILLVQVPPGLTYSKHERLDRRKDVAVLCSPPSPSTNYTLRCDVGNPLPFHAALKLRLLFQPRGAPLPSSSFDFRVTVNSTNPEAELTRTDNALLVHFPIRIQTDLDLLGVSLPKTVHHNRTQYATQKMAEADVGPEVVHVYEVKCEGPLDINEARVTIIWPAYTSDDKHFLYLLDQPFVEGPASCEAVDDVNPLGLVISFPHKYRAYRMGESSSTATISLPTNTATTASSSNSRSRSSEGVRRVHVGEGGQVVRGPAGHQSSVGRVGTGGGGGGGLDRESWHYEQQRPGPPGSGSGRTYSNYTRRTEQTNYSREFSSRRSGAHPTNTLEDDEYSEDDLWGRGGGRNRRGVGGGGAEARQGATELARDLSCGPRLKCIRIECRIRAFEKGKTVTFKLRGRVWSDTLHEKFAGQNVNISSRLITQVTELPFQVDPGYLRHRTREIFTSVEEDADLTEPRPIPWWVIALAVLAGILFLLLISYLLYKCGFFKRKRPRSGPESQPLHRNGNYYPGDERL